MIKPDRDKKYSIRHTKLNTLHVFHHPKKKNTLCMELILDGNSEKGPHQ